MDIVQAPTTQQILTDAGYILRCTQIALGAWNMLTTSEIQVFHLIGDKDKIFQVSCIVQNDLQTLWQDIHQHSSTLSGSVAGWIKDWSDIRITVARWDSGMFADAAYSSGAINRGWITIWYVI